MSVLDKIKKSNRPPMDPHRLYMGIAFILVIGWSGIIIGYFIRNEVPGMITCVAAGFGLAYLAALLPSRDIVSLLIPMFALIIFNPYNEIDGGFLMQGLFLVTIFGVSLRLNHYYNHSSEGKKSTIDFDQYPEFDDQEA
jgi:hypothetical protein